MKILFFSHGKRANGGAERCLLELVKALKQARPEWELYATFPADDELSAMLRPYLSGCAFIRQPWWLVRPRKNNLWRRLLFKMKVGVAIRKTTNYVRRINPDLAVTNTLATPIGAVSSRAAGCPHWWFIHEMPEVAGNLAYLFGEGRSLQTVDSLSQRLLVPSTFTRDYYSRLVQAPGKISVLYQSVNVTAAPAVRHDRPFTIAMLGNFEPNKGQHIAVQALRLVVASCPDTHLLLIGGNGSKYAHELRATISACGLDGNVTIIDRTPDPHPLLRQADIGLVCSRFETFGRVIVECLKCGLPVLVPDAPFGRELVDDGRNGLLFRRDDAADLAEKMMMLRHRDLDEMRRNALASVEGRFTGQAFANDFISLTNDRATWTKAR